MAAALRRRVSGRIIVPECSEDLTTSIY